MRVPTIVPALLLLGVSIAIALVAAGFGYAVIHALGQRCTDCPIDRSGQFVTIFAVYCVLILAIAAVHALVAIGIWRGSRWAIRVGSAISALGFVIVVLAGPPAYWLWMAPIAAAYAAALLSLLFARLEPA